MPLHSTTHVILLVGDLHFDPDPAPVDAARSKVGTLQDERELASCLRHYADAVTQVVLLGDVFDAYVEYPHVVPKPPVRLFGLLTEWHDRGVGVHYSVGNHDPWHRDWIERDLGWTLMRGPRTLDLEGIRLHVSHGDAEERGGSGRWTRIMRSRTAHRLYARLLPGDAGQGLARRVSRSARSPELVERTVHVLREHAHRVLTAGQADVVVYGHSHVPELERVGDGWYVNPGHWPATRTIGVIESGFPRLVRWTGTNVEDWHA